MFQNITLKKHNKIHNKTHKIDNNLIDNINIKTDNNTSSKTMTRLNESFADMLDKLSKLMLKKGEFIKSRAYSKAQETMLKEPNDITSAGQMKGKPGIGETILKKLTEYEETGKLEMLERYKNDPLVTFSDIYGVGPQKAKALVEKGIKNIEELREKQEELLNAVQKKGLKHYEDILERIPRNEIDKYNCEFANAFKLAAKDVDATYEIVGSYRRGAKTSGDIDVIITSEDPSIFPKFIDELQTQNIITEILSQGNTKCLVITNLGRRSTARRVDFMFTSKQEYPFAVLYFTGSKAFNTVMRGHALTMGYTMNEHGIRKNDKEKTSVNEVFVTEKDIFNFLNMEYKEPTERVDGNSVIITVEQPKLKPTLTTKKENKLTKKSVSYKNIAKTFKNEGINVVEDLTEKQLTEFIKKANDDYYNKVPILTDNEYDIVKEYAERKYPNNEELTVIGAPVKKNKVTLPYNMPSMDKIKPDTGALTKWLGKYNGPYVLSCKLDGVSGLYTTEGKEPKLYTRGDGKVGQDISHFIKHLHNLPNEKGLVVRGEFIIRKDVFDTKYKTEFANPRNMVSGIINSKTVDKKVKDVDFVAYEVIRPELTTSSQLEKVDSLNMNVVMNENHKSLTNEMLSDVLLKWRTEYMYEIDGVIVTDDKIHPRKDGNPEHAFAFKMVISDQVAEAKVVDVLWSASKNGYLKPKIQIEPVHLGGVKIEYATGFNAKFIESNQIGVGSVVTIIRSGDVIPYIKSVVQPAEKPKMPLVPYHWNETHVDIIVENIDEDQSVLEKRITAFFTGIEVDGLSTGNVKRIIKAGYNSIPKILKMTKKDFEKVEGFKEKMIDKVHNSIRTKTKDATLVKIMSVSNVLGRGLGERKIGPIMKAHPSILTDLETIERKKQKLQSVTGIGKENANSFVENMPAFMKFLKESELEYKLSQKVKSEDELQNSLKIDKSHPLYGKKVVMTKVRDAEIIDLLKAHGGEVVESVNKDTFALIVKAKEDVSNKTKKAIELNILILTPSEFKEKYM